MIRRPGVLVEGGRQGPGALCVGALRRPLWTGTSAYAPGKLGKKRSAPARSLESADLRLGETGALAVPALTDNQQGMVAPWTSRHETRTIERTEPQTHARTGCSIDLGLITLPVVPPDHMDMAIPAIWMS